MVDSRPERRRLSNLTLRIASAAVLAPVAIFAAWAGGPIFATLVAVVGVLGYLEWTRMSGMAAASPVRVCVAAAIGVGLLTVFSGPWQLAACLLFVPALVLIVAGFVLEQARWAGLGALYISVPAAGLILVRADPEQGLVAVLFVVLVVWATDVAAYFGGRTFGGPKLWPRVSPNKTWSGGFSGLTAALVVGAIVSAYSSGLPQPADIVVAGILSVFSQAGDFLESAVKRRFGVKDSGDLIPGHGGVLDRVDGILGASAVALVLALAGAGSILPDLGVPRTQ